jgi:hypothetical protein
MKNYDELTAMLSQGASISRERNMNLDFAKVADSAAMAIQELQAERDLAKSDAMRNAVLAVSFKAERDEYRKAADDQALAHKVERDGLGRDLHMAKGEASVWKSTVAHNQKELETWQRMHVAERDRADELRAKLSALTTDDELPPLPDFKYAGEVGALWDRVSMEHYARDAQAMLRAKLALQEPVAWRFVDDEDRGHVSYSTTPPTKSQIAYLAMWKRPTWQPLYAAGAAPQQNPCKGKNCGSTNGWCHSAECFAELNANLGEDEPIAWATSKQCLSVLPATSKQWSDSAGLDVSRFAVPLYLASGAAPQPAQWQPIDAAPRDETDILVMYIHIDTQIVHNAFWLDDAYAPEELSGWWSYDKSEVGRMLLDGWMTPTHWMPLPKHPQGEQQ